MVVAESFTAQSTGLGLGSPLALRGGEPDVLRRLARELGLGWHTQLRSIIDQAILAARDERSPWFKLPPLALIGERGVGRTHAARRIAYAAGLPHVSLDFADPAGVSQLDPQLCGPDLVLPSLPVLAMAIGGCANPGVSVVGVECLELASTHRLAAMINPASAAKFIDHATGCRVDLRQVNWLVQCSDLGALAPALAHSLLPVELIWPDERDLPLHVAEVLAEAAIDAGVIDQLGGQASDALAYLDRMGRRRFTAEIYEAARLWLGEHFG
jgi:hypothetical protein